MNIQDKTHHSLSQISTIVESLDDHSFRLELAVLQGNSIGKHVRHVIEFYTCLNDGYLLGEVDYDRRCRNQMLETNTAFALDQLAIVQIQVSHFQEKSLSLIVDYGSGVQTIQTSYLRELVYNIEHVVHHLAIIKIGIQAHFHQIQLDEDLGVAYSTLKFQQTNSK